MPDTVPVTFEVDPETAAALQDPATHARIEEMIRRTARPADVEQLFAAMDALAAEASRRGLTDEVLEEELAAYNAERRCTPSADDLVAQFRSFAAGHTLGNLALKDLITEGRR